MYIYILVQTFPTNVFELIELHLHLFNNNNSNNSDDNNIRFLNDNCPCYIRHTQR